MRSSSFDFSHDSIAVLDQDESRGLEREAEISVEWVEEKKLEGGIFKPESSIS